MRKLFVFCVLGIANLITASGSFAAHPIKAEKFTLPNGLSVVVVENHRAPVINHTLWIRAGAGDDPVGKSGLAHYLEHIFFKKTQHLADGEYAKIIESFGGEYNASTGKDFTNFYVTASRENLPEIMRLEAERMGFLQPEAKSFDSERQVIIEERRMRIDNNPAARLNEALEASLFRNHPYHTPTIGWRHEMEKLSANDVMGFYHQHYCPAHAQLVLVGDINLDTAKQLSEKYYGGWQNPNCKERAVWTSEPEFDTTQRVILRDETVQKASLSRVWLADNLKTNLKNSLSLLVLTDILGAPRTGLLYQELVEKDKTAIAVNVNYSPFVLGPASFSIDATPAEGVTIEKLEESLDNALRNIIKPQQIQPDSLNRTRNLLKAESIYALDNVQGMASILGQLLMLGFDEKFFNEWPDKIAQVSQTDVEAAAQQILGNPHAITGILLPKEAKKK